MIASLKKREFGANLLSKSDQYKIDKNEFNIINISNKSDLNNTKDKSGPWFWNKSINKSNLNLKKEKNDINKKDLEEKHSKIESIASLKILKKERK